MSRDGRAGPHAGVLEDHGCVASGFLSLLQATGDPRWLTRADAVLEVALTHFRAEDGGFHDTADDAEALVARPRDPSDNASPSGLSATVHALAVHAALTGSGRHREAAEQALATTAALAAQAPRFAGWSLAAAVAMREGPREIAVVGPPGAARDALARAARRDPAAVVVVAEESPGEHAIPLLTGRTTVDGPPRRTSVVTRSASVPSPTRGTCRSCGSAEPELGQPPSREGVARQVAEQQVDAGVEGEADQGDRADADRQAAQPGRWPVDGEPSGAVQPRRERGSDHRADHAREGGAGDRAGQADAGAQRRGGRGGHGAADDLGEGEVDGAGLGVGIVSEVITGFGSPVCCHEV